jgi:integrase
MQFLSEHAKRYILSQSLSPAYEKQVIAKCTAFEAHFGRGLPIAELQSSPELLSGFLLHLEAQGLALTTVRGYRAVILAVWEDALPPGQHSPNRDVRRIRRVQTYPQCWDQDELSRLLRVARRARGHRHDGAKWCDWWVASILGGYYTGQRIGDLLRLRAEVVRPDGRAVVLQRKTGKLVAVQFDEEGLAAASRLPQGPLLLPWPYSIEMLRRRFRRLVNEAQIRPGTFKWLRRSAGSHLERVQPGTGHRLLGNTRAVFEVHYADPAIIVGAPLVPPPIA